MLRVRSAYDGSCPLGPPPAGPRAPLGHTRLPAWHRHTGSHPVLSICCIDIGNTTCDDAQYVFTTYDGTGSASRGQLVSAQDSTPSERTEAAVFTNEEFKALEHGGWYRLHFEQRTPWNAIVLNAGPEPKLRYLGERGGTPQDFPLAVDSDGHMTLPTRSHFGRLVDVTRPRSRPPGLTSPMGDTDPPQRVMVSIRIPADQLAEIDQRAESAGCTRTEYMLRAALGGDPLDQRLAAIEHRLIQLEEANSRSRDPSGLTVFG